MAQRDCSGRSLEKRVEALRENRVSGAVDLALEALDLAGDWLANDRPAAELAAELRTMHPAIASVGSVARLLEGPGGGLSARVTETRTWLREGNQKIARNLRPLIPAGSSIITLSNSSTVREAMFLLEPARVYLMRSLPGGEGEGQAKALRQGFADRAIKASAEVIPDGTIANVVPLVDCALVGIDSYDPKGAILHKVGTLPLALCCRQFDKPFYAAGHSLKRSDRVSRWPEPIPGSDEEMFDRTPGELITHIVTEQGLLE